MALGIQRCLLVSIVFLLGMGIGSLVSAEQPGPNPSEERQPSAGYEEALFNTQNALRATDEKDAEKAVNYARLASKATQFAATYAKEERDPEAAREFIGAIKLLDDGMGFLAKANYAGAKERFFTVLDTLKQKRCQGLLCTKNACGGCAMPGQTNCDNLNKSAICHVITACRCSCF